MQVQRNIITLRTANKFAVTFGAGVPVRDIFLTLIEEATHLEVKPDIDEVCKKKKEISLETIAEIGTPKIDAVVDIARKYHGKVPMAVASSGDRHAVLSSLRENNILHLFDAVVTAEEVTNHKPAPDIFLLAAKRIGCDPTKCRGYEDADIGMKSVRAAGMQAIDVRLMPGYPKVVPSTRSVLLPDNDDDVEVTELDGRPASLKSSGQRGGAWTAASEKSNKSRKTRDEDDESGSGLRGFLVQAAVFAGLAFGAYHLLNHLMFDAVREDAWSAD